MPLEISIKLFNSKDIKGFLNVGGFGSYWLWGRMNGMIPDIFNVIPPDNNLVPDQQVRLKHYSTKYKFDPGKDARFEFGLTSGIGIYQSIFYKNSVFIEINFYHSLTDQQKGYSINQPKKINQTLLMEIGFIRNFTLKN